MINCERNNVQSENALGTSGHGQSSTSGYSCPCLRGLKHCLLIILKLFLNISRDVVWCFTRSLTLSACAVSIDILHTSHMRTCIRTPRFIASPLASSTPYSMGNWCGGHWASEFTEWCVHEYVALGCWHIGRCGSVPTQAYGATLPLILGWSQLQPPGYHIMP